MAERPQRPGAAKKLLQPFDEWRRAVEQSKRLITRRKFDVDFYDRAAVHEICDGRHELNDQRFQKDSDTRWQQFLCDFIVIGIVTQLLRTLSRCLDRSYRKGAVAAKTTNAPALMIESSDCPDNPSE
jgi:hypothetical protein